MQNAEALLAFAEQWQCLNIAPVRIIVLKWDETSKGKNLYSEIVKARKKKLHRYLHKSSLGKSCFKHRSAMHEISLWLAGCTETWGLCSSP